MRGNICLPSRPLSSVSNLSGSRFLPEAASPSFVPTSSSFPPTFHRGRICSRTQLRLPACGQNKVGFVSLKKEKAASFPLTSSRYKGAASSSRLFVWLLPSALSSLPRSLVEFYSNTTERSRCVIDHHSARVVGQKRYGRRCCFRKMSNTRQRQRQHVVVDKVSCSK